MNDRTGPRIVRTVYPFFLGALLALFVGLGVAAVRPAAEEPRAPSAIVTAQESRELTPEEQQRWAAYERDREVWEGEVVRRNREVAGIAVVAAVLLLVLGLALERRMRVLADGALLGGILTLLYGVVRSMIAQDTLVSFGVVTLTLALVLYLGYRRYVDRPSATGDDPGPAPVVVSSNGRHPSRH